MKTVLLVMLGLATSLCVTELCSAESPMSFRVTPDGSGSYVVEGAVDLLAFSKPERTARQIKAAETAARRQNMSVREVAVDHVQMNWGKYLAAISAIALDRVAENNDWLYYKWFDDDKASASGVQAGDSTATTTTTTTTTTVNGGGNTVIIQNPSAPGADTDANAGDRPAGQ